MKKDRKKDKYTYRYKNRLVNRKQIYVHTDRK